MPLPIGKRRPVHADGCVESLRQTIDNLSKRGGVDGTPKLLVARPKTGDEEVLTQGRIQQVAVLGHLTDACTQLIRGDRAHVPAADGDGPRTHVPVAHDEPEQGRLAST